MNRFAFSLFFLLGSSGVDTFAFGFNFDSSASYAPAFVLAQASDGPMARYARYLGFDLRAGLKSELGVIEASGQFGFEASPYLQDLALYSLSLRRYLYRQTDFGPAEFWSQKSSRKFELYYLFGLSRLQQSSAFLGQTENVEVINIRSWGPTAAVGADWYFAPDSPIAAFFESRAVFAIWPESVPPFVFSVLTFSGGFRSRF
jgi:hypothetical protein